MTLTATVAPRPTAGEAEESTAFLAALPLPGPTRTRVADVLVSTLQELGVRTFLGIPGGAISSIYDALLDRPELRLVNNRHESGAVFAAMGYARLGGSLPCVLVTSGPGITNALTGVAAAHAEGIPLLILGGEVPKRNFGRGALQEGSRYQLDVLAMMRSVTKMAEEITHPQAASTLLRKAVATALSGRQGPVFLSLPLDVANEKVLATQASATVRTSFDLDEAMVARAARALQGSQRALILAGSGCRHPETLSMLGAVASTLQVPVATTPKAKGLFPENDPLSLGVFGLGGHPSATDYLAEGIDTLLALGCGLGEVGTNSWSPSLRPTQTFIQVDIDPGQIGKNYHVDLGLIGPAHLVLQRLMSKLRRRLVAHTVSGIRHYQAEQQFEDTVPLRHPRVLQLLQERMPADTVYTSDIGEHTLFAVHYLRANLPDTFQLHAGLGSMGSGIGAAVGAKLAAPRRPVVALCGDFGFQMGGMELMTCVQERLGTVFLVFNDARMRMVESGQGRVFGRPGRMEGPRGDFAGLARSMGAYGFNIRCAEDFAAVPEEALLGDRPCVLDVETDPTAAFPVQGRVAQIKNFNS